MAFHFGLRRESAIARPVACPAIDLASAARFRLCPAMAKVDWAAAVRLPATARGWPVLFSVLAVLVARSSPEAGPVCPRAFRSARFDLAYSERAAVAVAVVVVVAVADSDSDSAVADPAVCFVVVDLSMVVA